MYSPFAICKKEEQAKKVCPSAINIEPSGIVNVGGANEIYVVGSESP